MPRDSESPAPAAEAEAEAAVGDTGVVELEASTTGETKGDNPAVATAAASPQANGGGGDEAEAGTAAGTGALTRDFPAWVLPKAAVLEVGQESGPLPSQWSALKKEYTKGCQFLLTLQVGRREEGPVDRCWSLGLFCFWGPVPPGGCFWGTDRN